MSTEYGRNRTRTVTFPASAEEHEAMKVAATSDQRTLSNWIRVVVARAIEQQKEEPK